MNKILVIGLVAVGIIAVSGVFFPQVTERIIERVETKLGAVSTLDGVDMPYVTIGGNKTYFYNQGMNASSSVVCSVKNPFQATSTLVNYSAGVTNNPLTGLKLYFDLATSTNQYQAGFTTGTAFLYHAMIADGTDGAFSWSPRFGTSTVNELFWNTSMSGGNMVSSTSPFIVGPNDYVTLRISTSTPGTFASYLTGSCSAIMQKL